MGTLWRPNTFFFKIFTSFSIVILLLVSVNYITSSYFRSKVEGEIIRYNQTTLDQTVDGYENYLKTLRGMLSNLLFDDKISTLHNQFAQNSPQQVDYLKVEEVLGQLRSNVSNSSFHLDNLIILFNSGIVLEKEGISASDRMFSRFYVSEHYPTSFWLAQLTESNFKAKMLSMDTFQIGLAPQSSNLIPYVVQNEQNHFIIIALIKANNLYDDLQRTVNSTFVIKDDQQQIFSTDRAPSTDPSTHFYSFSEKGKFSGLTYDMYVPNENIHEQTIQMNVTLIFICLIALFASLLISYLFSTNIHRPVKQILVSMEEQSSVLPQSKIMEFNAISQKFRDLTEEKSEVQKELVKKSKLLTNYGYISKLKNIQSDLKEWNDFPVISGSILMILYRLDFRSTMPEQMTAFTEKAAAYYTQFIDMIMKENFKLSHSFQPETNEILTLIFADTNRELVRQTMNYFKQVFDKDSHICLITITVGSVFESSSDIKTSYQEVLDMANGAKLMEETQIIYEHPVHTNPYVLSVIQEQQFNAALQNGDLAACLQLVNSMYAVMVNKEAKSLQYKQFSEMMVAKTIHNMEHLVIKSDYLSTASINSLFKELKHCDTLDQYKAFFASFFQKSIVLIQDKKAEKDETIDFIINLLENDFTPELSLEWIADRLNLTSSYLSQYIKDKTGMTFSDHLNQVRIRKAKQLLVSTELSINEISEALGYQNGTSFIRMFKKSTGDTPGGYRRKKGMDTE
ncbi:helix-turn-helix domain-containing protein [Paenibacillus sp. P36]|uniref:helix-turn-helix domain-containing protein n=1 Tax=Paenibacillus sp. P36 TaxID=3342538 RepID=UPI0038B36035